MGFNFLRNASSKLIRRNVTSRRSANAFCECVCAINNTLNIEKKLKNLQQAVGRPEGATEACTIAMAEAEAVAKDYQI